MTVDELPKITGAIQFRLIEDGNGIVDVVNGLNCFKFERRSGNKWVTALGYGQNTNCPVDVIRLEFGNNQPHSNVSPTIACYVWTRTA